MRFARTFVLTFLSLLLTLPALAQQTTTSTLQRDPQAIELIQQTLTAMGSAQALLFQDSLASGQATIYKPDGTSITLPIVKKSKGTTMTRTELQRPEGMRVRVVNGGVGAIQNADGTVRPLFPNNTIAERVEHIPGLSILSEWQSPNIEIRYIGANSVNGKPAQVISLSLIPTADAQWLNLYRAATQTVFYIDQSTSLVSKIQYQNFAENDSNVSEKVEIFFSNYQLVSGVQVPFIQASYADGHLRSTLTFSSVTFNAGLAPSEFTVPGGN